MPASVNFNGAAYSIPVNHDPPGWGTSLSVYLAALAAGAAGVSVANTFNAPQSFVSSVLIGTTLQINGPILGNLAGNETQPLYVGVTDGNTTAMRLIAHRFANGSDFNTADDYLSKVVDVTAQGFVGYFSASGAAGAIGVGLGYGAPGTAPTLFVSQAGAVTTTAGFKSILTGFYAPNVLANRSTVIFPQAGVATLMIWVAPFAGSVVGISTNFSDGSNIAAGTVTLDVYKTSGVLITPAVTWTSGDHGSATFARGTYPFAAGQYLYVKYSTSAGLSPAGTEGLMASLIVEMAA